MKQVTRTRRLSREIIRDIKDRFKEQEENILKSLHEGCKMPRKLSDHRIRRLSHPYRINNG